MTDPGVSRDSRGPVLRRGIIEHLRTRRFTIEEYAVFNALLPLADWYTGVWIGSAALLFHWWGCARKTVGEAMRRLRQRHYINYPDGIRHGDYPIVVIGHQKPEGAKVTWDDSNLIISQWLASRTTEWSTIKSEQERKEEACQDACRTTEWSTVGSTQGSTVGSTDLTNGMSVRARTVPIDSDSDSDTEPKPRPPEASARLAPRTDWKAKYQTAYEGLAEPVRELVDRCMPMWRQVRGWSWERAAEIASQWAKLPAAQVAAGLRQYADPRTTAGGVTLESWLTSGKPIGYAHAIVLGVKDTAVARPSPGNGGTHPTRRPIPKFECSASSRAHPYFLHDETGDYCPSCSGWLNDCRLRDRKPYNGEEVHND